MINHLGNAERSRIFADVRFPAEDDTREIHLSPAEIVRLTYEAEAAGGHKLSLLIRVALLTSADRGVLLSGRHQGKTYRGLRVRGLRIYHDIETGAYTGEVYLSDSKTESRSRSVPLTDAMCRELLAQTKSKAPDDPVFALTYSGLDYVWRQARAAAGLSHVRFKDLRAQVSIYGEEAGIPQTVLQRTMGHSDAAMTRRYQARAAAMSNDQAEAIEAAMFQASEPTGKEHRKTG